MKIQIFVGILNNSKDEKGILDFEYNTWVRHSDHLKVVENLKKKIERLKQAKIK